MKSLNKRRDVIVIFHVDDLFTMDNNLKTIKEFRVNLEKIN